MTGNTTVVPKFVKPLGGKPFVIPSGVQNGAALSKNIPVVVAVSSKKKLENKKDFKKDFTRATGAKTFEKKSVVVKPNATSEKQQVDSKKPVVKSTKSVVTTNNWWEESTGTVPRVVFAEEQPWYTQYPAFVGQEIDISTPDNSKINESRFAPILKAVEAAFQAEQAFHGKKNGKSSDSDQKWINDVIKSGTLSDKVAALALRVQESPFYQLETLDILVQMACKKEQRTSQLALEAIKDLLANNLLPDRRLTVFRSSLLLHSEMTMTTALMLYYEDQLKTRIERVMDALDNGMKSTVDYFKKLCLEMAASLLMSKPEQEARLLSMIVNKLGDPSSKICSKCISVLRNVVSVHPAMKVVIVREVRQFIYRPNIKLKSIFNGVIFLSQVTLVRGDHNVATQLVECYVSLFEKAVKEDELGSRLLSALLTGINKSFPYLDNIESISKHADSLFRLVHTASFTSSTQALMLLSHLAISSSDSVLKEKPKEKKIPQEGVTDEDDEEVVEVVQAPAGPDDLGSDIMRRYYRALYAKLLSDQVTSRAKNTLLLNLLYRSIKRDPSEHRAMAFLKRLSICATQASPSIAAGLLFLVSEIIASRPSLKLMLDSTEEASIFTTQEIYLASVDEEESHNMLGNFDASKREPEYAAAARPSIWEGALMRRHFHPSVQAFAHALLEAPTHRINFAGDPTTDFSLMAFLNRFAYKNPKKSVAEKIQGQQRRQGLEEEPMNVSKFIRSDEAEVAPDKHFFHKYFGERAKLREDGRSRDRSKKRKGKRDSDSGSSDEESDGEAGDSADEDDEEKEEKRLKKQEKKDKKASKAQGVKGQLDSDEEAEMDAFATQLAEDMMRDKDATFDMDPDMDDWSEDEEGSDDDNSEVGSGNDFTDEDENEINGGDDDDDEEESGSDSDGEDEDEDASDYSDEDGGDGMLEAYQSSDDEESVEEEAPAPLTKKQLKAQKGGGQKTTDAVDFADYLKQQESQKDAKSKSKAVKSDKTPAAQKFVDDMKNTLSKASKAKKDKKKKTVNSDSEDSEDSEEEDAFGGLEEYVSESEPEAAPVKFLKKKNDKKSDAVETNKKDSKKSKKVSSKEEEDDLEVVESYSDYSSLDDEEEDFDVLFGEGDGGGDKKGKKGGKLQQLQQSLKGKKGGGAKGEKDKKTKRKRGDDGGDFASAEDYEGEMDAILKQIQAHNSGEAMDVDEAPASNSSKKGDAAKGAKTVKKFRK